MHGVAPGRWSLVGIHRGVRLKSEGLTLRLENLHLARETVTVGAVNAKTGKARTIPIN
jgi:hypothetical protein